MHEHGNTGKKRFLNLGCGPAFHPEWVNVDFSDQGGAVVAYNLRLGIPFADNTFEVVYHSHVLEHFNKDEAEYFIEECFRVLRPGGLLRVVVPDLENVAKAYLQTLDDARNGSVEAEEKHQWMLIELLDQMVRQESGGKMLEYWLQQPMPAEKFVLERMGQEAERVIANSHKAGFNASTPQRDAAPLRNFNPAFINSGELHRWMYDEFSLAALLRRKAFIDVGRLNYDDSRREDIISYGLDRTETGRMRKPYSLVMEAVKPPREIADIRLSVLSTADSGGAGIAALRLHESLLGSKISSLMYVASQKKKTPGVYLLPTPTQPISVNPAGEVDLAGRNAYNRQRHNIIESRYPDHPWIEYFTVPGQCGNIETLPFMDDFDVINLNWISGFIDPGMSLKALKNKPVIITVHDMNPFTGGCHYSGTCTAYAAHCGSCPLLGSTDPEDLSFATWRSKMRAFREMNIHVVCTTHWMAEKVSASSLLGKFPVHVIPYALPLDIFRPLNRKLIRKEFNFAQEDFILMFSAQSLGNQRKGAKYVLEAMRRLAETPLASKTRILLLGDNPPAELLATGIKTETAGHVNDPEKLAIFYNAADALLFPSLEEAYGQVTTEAIACGTPTIAFASGGIPETIEHRNTGWLAETGNLENFLAGIHWAEQERGKPDLHLRCRAAALERWSFQKTTQKFIDLIYQIRS